MTLMMLTFISNTHYPLLHALPYIDEYYYDSITKSTFFCLLDPAWLNLLVHTSRMWLPKAILGFDFNRQRVSD